MNQVDDIHETMAEGHLLSLDTILHDALNEHQEYSRIISPDEFVTQTSSPFSITALSASSSPVDNTNMPSCYYIEFLYLSVIPQSGLFTIPIGREV